MSNELFITIDTETGGFDPNKNPLLQVGVYISTYNPQTFESKHIISCLWNVNPMEYSDNVTCEQKALDINGLSYKVLFETGISLHQLSNNLLTIINKVINDITENTGHHPKVTILGQNLAFDLRFIRKWLSKEVVDLIDSFMFEDLMSRIRDYNILCPSYNDDGSRNESRHLNDFLKRINLVNENAHAALDDAKYTMLAYIELSKILFRASQQ